MTSPSSVAVVIITLILISAAALAPTKEALVDVKKIINFP
jgi:hypothetical protein